LIMGLKYRYSSDNPLANNITAIWGEEDKVYPKSDIEAWSSYTSGHFAIETIKEGSHIFIRDKRDKVIELINKTLH